jgi:protein TonB
MLTSLVALVAMDSGLQARPRTPPPPPLQTSPVPPRPVQVQPTAPPPPPVYTPPRADTLPRPTPPPAPPPAPPTPPRLRSGSISDADYPASAFRAEAEGTAQVEIDVGPNGRVTGCTVSQSSGNSALDSTTCSLITRRFRYAPATRNGAPVAARVTQQVTWVLPPDYYAQFAPGSFTWTAVVAEEMLRTCSFTWQGRAFEESGRKCGEAGVAPVDFSALTEEDAPMRVTTIVRLLPAGTQLPGSPPPNPAHAVTAAIEVDWRGRVTGCTVTSETGELSYKVEPMFRDMCRELTDELAMGFEGLGRDAAPRRGVLQQYVYVEPVKR